MTQNIKPPTRVAKAAVKAIPSTAVAPRKTTKPKVALKATKASSAATVKPKVAVTPSKATPAITVKPKLAVKTTKTTPAPKRTPTKPKVVAKVASVVSPIKPLKIKKPKKQKMVRDSFTMPENDYAHIVALKKRCLKAGASVKKSELLRAALQCLTGLTDQALLNILTSLEPIKTGRPAKS